MDQENLKKYYEIDGKRPLDKSLLLLEEYRFNHILSEIAKICKPKVSLKLRILDAGAGAGQLFYLSFGI